MVLETQTFLDNYIFSSGSSEESSSGSEESSDEEERRPSAGAGGSRRDEQERRRAPGGRERYTPHKITNNSSPLNTKFTISNSGRGSEGRRRSQRRGEAEGRRGEDLLNMKEVGGQRRRNPQRIRRKQQS